MPPFQTRLVTLQSSNRRTRRPQITVSEVIKRRAQPTQLELPHLVGKRRVSLAVLAPEGTFRALSLRSRTIVGVAQAVPSHTRDLTMQWAMTVLSTSKLMRWKKAEVAKSASNLRKSNRQLSRRRVRSSKLIRPDNRQTLIWTLRVQKSRERASQRRI